MRFKLKKFILICLPLLILSCDDFFSRFDPLEAGRNILTLEELNFFAGLNPQLSMNTRGEINQYNMSISIIMPPSLDLTANKLLAEGRIRKESERDYEEFHLYMSRYWLDGDVVTVDRKDFDPEWEGDSSFVNEYTLRITREFLCRLSLLDTSPPYSSNPDFNIRIKFNDLAEPVVGPLTQADFMNGLIGTNFVTPLDGVNDFAPSLPAASKGYDWTLHAQAEGVINVTLSAGSILHNTPPLMANSQSNTLFMVYDATSPVLPGVSSVSVTGLNNAIPITDYRDALLTLAFNESSDVSDLTPRKKLTYRFTVEFPPGTTYSLPYQGMDNVPYQSSYTWNYYEMPWDLQNLLKFNNNLGFFVTVFDLAGNSTTYPTGYQVYNGPSTF